MSQFCTNCGEKIEDGRFCPACGAPVEDDEQVLVQTKEVYLQENEDGIRATVPSAEKKARRKASASEKNDRETPPISDTGSRAVTPSGEIILGSDGVYRWAYDMNILTNPTIFITVWKVFAFSFGLVFVFVCFLDMSSRNFWFEGFLELVKVFGLIILGMTVLLAVALIIYAAIMGGKYCVLFEMNEKGVKHIQAPKQFKKAQVMALILGVTSKNIGRKGQALLIASKSESHSEWRVVRSISCHPRTHVIKVNELLEKNQVYVGPEDFEFVKNYIISHCPNAKIK